MNPLQQLSPEALLEQGTSLVKKTAKIVGQQTGATVQTAATQITGQQMSQPSDGSAVSQPIQRDKQTTDFVKDLYGADDQPHQSKLPAVTHQGQGGKVTSDKTATDQKLADTRQRLAQLLQSQHTSTYYDPTFNRPKQQEEKPVEKLEREEQEERWLKHEKDKKKLPSMAVQMGANKAERFPGASG